MRRVALIAGFTALCIVAALLMPAMPQPLDYHEFADRRSILGISNCVDVISNIGFLIAGVVGLYVVSRPATAFESGSERVPYVVFFIGVLLTAFGSSYYHLAPDNERLFWDRLPMTIAFMSLIAAQIADRIDSKVGLYLLVPMLVIGAWSVVYWRITERAGMGNVMPYGILQGYSIVILLVLAALHRSRYTHGNDIYWVFACYVAAKALEALDAQIFALGKVVSGHTLKHLAAAVAGLMVCRMLWRRRAVSDASVKIP